LNRTKREVELSLDEFALEEVERVAERLGVPRARVVERAVRHWLEERGSGRLATQPLSVPRQASAPPAVPLAVDLPSADWEAVRQVAEAQKVEPERLVGHAVLLLLADVDAGRLAARVARSENGFG
jgi:Ribbon-helix-helix protein, copG family